MRKPLRVNARLLFRRHAGPVARRDVYDLDRQPFAGLAGGRVKLRRGFGRQPLV